MTDPQAKIDDGGWANNKSLRFETAQIVMHAMFSSEFGARIADEMTENHSIPDAAFMVADAMIAAARKDNTDD